VRASEHRNPAGTSVEANGPVLLSRLRSVVRPLLARPAFSAVVVLTLALGIGLNTAIYTVLDAALIRTLPFRAPERLVRVDQIQLDHQGRNFGYSWPGLLELRERQDIFSGVAACNTQVLPVRLGDHTELVPGAAVTGNLLEVLGVHLLLGRDFRPEEEGPQSPPLAILAHAFWRDRLGADPGVVGRSIAIDGKPYTVVGVLSPEFRWPGLEAVPGAVHGLPEVLVTIVPGGDEATRRNATWLGVVARLRDGVTLEQARARLEALAARLRSDFPVDQLHVGVQAVPLRDSQVGSVRPVLLVLWGAVVLLLVLTCANVANLLLARAVSREHEMAVRSALGATRGDLVRKLLGESFVLGLAGALLGWLLARAALPALTAGIPPAQRTTLPFLQDLRLDSAALLYSVALAVLTSVLFGVVPALRLSRSDLATTMKEAGLRSGTPGRHRAMQLLVLVQVALAVVLLNGAGVFARSLTSVLAVDPGFRPEGVVVGTLSLPRRNLTGPETLAMMDRVVASAAAVPSVSSVGVTTRLPGTTDTGRMGVRAAGTADPTTFATSRIVTDGYFETLGVPLLRGRLLGPQDHAGTPPVAVVNETFVRLHFPGRDGLGERFQLTYKPDGETFTVVGVVRDERLGAIDSPPPEAFYIPWRQNAQADLSLALAVRSPRGAAVIPDLRRAVLAVDGDLALQSLQEMPAMLGDSPAVFGRRYPVWLLGVFASCATLLAAIGLFGVLSYVVSERTHELGIRIALGARPRAVILDVARRALPAVLGGLVVGILGSALVGGALRGLLFQSRGFDLRVLLPVVAAMLLTAVLALLVPARRAAAVDPSVALRAE
jgi:putative ABC transport system permease protein